MPKKAYGRRYAQAIFELALEKNELERWQSDLQKISDVVADKEFLAALESPKISFEKKSELTQGFVCHKFVHPIIRYGLNLGCYKAGKFSCPCVEVKGSLIKPQIKLICFIFITFQMSIGIKLFHPAGY